MSLLLTIVVAFVVYKYFYGASSSNKLTPITPIVDEGMKEMNDGSKIVDNDVELEDHPILIHLDLNDFLQVRDDKDSSDDSSSLHDNDISSDATSESSNDGKITIVGGVTSDDDYGSDKIIDDDDDDDDDDKYSSFNSSLESTVVDSIH